MNYRILLHEAHLVIDNVIYNYGYRIKGNKCNLQGFICLEHSGVIVVFLVNDVGVLAHNCEMLSCVLLWIYNNCMTLLSLEIEMLTFYDLAGMK